MEIIVPTALTLTHSNTLNAHVYWIAAYSNWIQSPCVPYMQFGFAMIEIIDINDSFSNYYINLCVIVCIPILFYWSNREQTFNEVRMWCSALRCIALWSVSRLKNKISAHKIAYKCITIRNNIIWTRILPLKSSPIIRNSHTDCNQFLRIGRVFKFCLTVCDGEHWAMIEIINQIPKQNFVCSVIVWWCTYYYLCLNAWTLLSFMKFSVYLAKLSNSMQCSQTNKHIPELWHPNPFHQRWKRLSNRNSWNAANSNIRAAEWYTSNAIDCNLRTLRKLAFILLENSPDDKLK